MITLQSRHVWLGEEYVPATIRVDEESGRIAEILPGLDEQAENALESVDCYVLPGIIDCHTHAAMAGPGGDRIGDTNDPNHFVTPFFRAVDAADFLNECYDDAAEAGISQVCVLPGAYCVVGGQAGMLLTAGDDPFGRIADTNVGMKVALGMRPKMAADLVKQSPQTKMAVYAMLREAIVAAKRTAENPGKGRDLGLEGWQPVLDGEKPLRLHCHRPDDILKAIGLAEEMGVKLVLEHATGALELADELVKRDIPVVSTNTIFRVPQTLEEHGATEHIAADLMKKGVQVALATNFPEVSWEALQIQACECLREGVAYKDVIDSLTIVPARITGQEHEAGSLQKGYFADLSVWTAAYGSFDARCKATMVRGQWAKRGGWR